MGAVLLALPKAIAYYLVALPLMLVNFIGTVRKGIQEQPREPMGNLELIAWALPAYLFAAAVGFITGLIRGLVTHTLRIGDIIPVGALIGAVIVSIVMGFVWHPLLSWWVKLLKGKSDERERTNLFVQLCVATMLVAIPGGLGNVLSLVPFRLILMLPPLLSLYGTAVMVFLMFSWFTHFGVLKWFRMLILAGGAISAVFAVLGAVAALTTTPVTAASYGSTADVEKLQAEAGAQLKQAEAEAQKATEKAEKAIDQAEKAADKAPEKAPAPEKVEKAADAAKVPPPPPAPEKAPADKGAVAASPATASGSSSARRWSGASPTIPRCSSPCPGCCSSTRTTKRTCTRPSRSSPRPPRSTRPTGR